MPSIDAVSRINFAELDNAVNNTLKAVAARFDYRNSPVEIVVDRKEKKIKMTAADDGKMKGLQEMFTSAAIKRGLEMRSFEFGEIEQGRHGESKREIKLKEGLTSENAKAIAKLVKESKIKVQASIQGDEVRLSGKQIDDIRAVMAMLDKAGLEQPLQYVNMKS
jgi:cyclic-di-GMP-binding protein